MIHKFPDKNALAARLAIDIISVLSAGIEQNGVAILAVSGGSTTKILFQTLSKMPLDWEKIIVTLVDERWVEENSARSNARLVKTNLLQNEAKSAKFVPLFLVGIDLPGALAPLEDVLQKLRKPFDVVILGMGTDGHTASFFPNADNLVAAVDLSNRNMLSAIYSDSLDEPRITFNLPVLISANFLALHLEGAEKLSVLKKAQQSGDANAMPIRHVLNNAKQLQTYYCP